jgi:predicted metallo-beta-lactamase superfamily hydrolase
MDTVIDFLNKNPKIKLVILLLVIAIVLKIIYEVLKVTKVLNIQDKSFVDTMYSILFKKSYLIKQAKQALRQGMCARAGKIFEEIGDYKRALKVYEDGNEFNLMGDLYLKLNKETQAI